MNRLARIVRFLLALLALLSYALLPVLYFEKDGVALYTASGLTLGLFFARWMLIPLIALTALVLTAPMRGRGPRLACALLSLACLGVLGVWISWLPSVPLPVNADWLFEHATSLRFKLEQAGQVGMAALMERASDLRKVSWGYLTSLA